MTEFHISYIYFNSFSVFCIQQYTYKLTLGIFDIYDGINSISDHQIP